MAIYDTIKLSSTQFQHEPVHIFANSLNSLYLLNTQIKYPSIYNNHPNKTILSEMVKMLQQRNHPLIIYKMCTHSNICGNDKADFLAKEGNELEYRHPCFPHEYAHSTPYYLHKEFWLGNMMRTPYKGPIRHLQTYLTKYYNLFLLEHLEEHFPYISKWTNDPNIDHELSNSFWKNSQIIKAQIKQLLKFCTRQYMGNTTK